MRLIRLVVSRSCTLQEVIEYVNNTFNVNNTFLKDSNNNCITGDSFARILLNQGLKCATLHLQKRIPEVRQQRMRFKGYLKLLNHGKVALSTPVYRQKSFIKCCDEKENISIKARTVFRQNCFSSGMESPSAKRRKISQEVQVEVSPPVKKMKVSHDQFKAMRRYKRRVKGVRI